MRGLDVETETVRVVDCKVAFGTAMYEGGDDGWPALLDKIRAAEILVVATPIWLGERSSVAKLVAERLDATTYQLDGRKQHEMYGKVGGAIVVGESDGGQASIKSILYDMSIAGFTIPPNADVYWVNEAGLGGPYLESHGDTSYFVNERVRWMAHNLAFFAGLLKANPIPTGPRYPPARGEEGQPGGEAHPGAGLRGSPSTYWKTSPSGRPRAAASRKASSRDGAYFEPSMATIVWRVTPARSARCCWVISPHSKRRRRMALRTLGASIVRRPGGRRPPG